MSTTILAGQAHPVADFLEAESFKRISDSDLARCTAADLQGCDRLILSLPLMDEMVRLGFSLVETAKAAGVGHIVQLSHYGAANDAHWRMGREIGRIDLAVEQSGISFTILRPNMLMSTLTDAVDLQNATLSLPYGETPVSYLHPADLAASIMAVSSTNDHAGRTYAITGPQGLTAADATVVLADALESTLVPETREEAAYSKDMQAQGKSEWQRDMLISLARIAQRGMMGNVTGAVCHLTDKAPATFADFTDDLLRSGWRPQG